LQGVKCRKIKELFSQYYATHKPDESWACLESTRVGIRERKVDLGEFEVARISELDERMRDYRASEFVLEWLKLDRQIRPEEEHFVNALMAGRSVDLRGWANVLIEAGLMNLRVAEGANALLTGGSCSWKWFQDLIKEHALFKGRQTAVHNDTRPELTIARGLARVYAVGSYSKQLVQEVQASRDNLVLDLKAIHSGLLDTLSLELTALMKADDRLIGDLRLIFRDSIREVRASARQNMSQPSIGKVLDGIMRDHFAELVRPRLEARTSKWLNDNQLKLRRWSERFAIAAHQHIRDVLKKNIRSEIGGLVEVAIEACDATGGTPFDEALAELGGKVRFGPSIVDRLLKQGIDIWNRLFPGLATEASASDSDQQIENEASQAIERLVTALPGAIRTSIVGVQPAQRWADQVINHLLKTLRMLVMVARVEEANDARDRAY